MKASASALVVCSAALCTAFQDQPEITSQQAPATFSTRVNLVSVPVVVRDGKGRAVGNLRQEDFRLFDKGKPQIISKFSIQVNGAPAASGGRKLPAVARTKTSAAAAETPGETTNPATALPDHYVAYLFDDVHLKFEDLARVRTAAEHHFSGLAPSSRAAIFTTSGRVTLDFTDDRVKLRATLLRIAPSPSAAPPPGSECPDVINPYLADQVLNQQNGEAVEAAAAELMLCFPAVTKAAIEAYSERALAANQLNVRAAVNVMAVAVQRLSVMPGSRAIVLASPGFMVFSDSRAQEMDLTERAIRANIVINSLDARGLYTPLMGGAAENQAGLPVGHDPESLRIRYRRLEADANKDVMAELADGTGGKFFHDDNGFEEGLNQLAAPPEFVYVLGFSPQNLKSDGRFHALKVALVNLKGLDVQARRGYWAPDHATDPAEEAREEIKEAVFSQEELQDIPLDVQTEFFKLSDTETSLTVSSHIDVTRLQFTKSADRNGQTLTIVTGLFNSNGTYVKGTQRVVDLKLRDQTLDSLRGSGLTVEEKFDVPPGRYFVRVVVRDSQGQSMAARNGGVEIQ